MVLPRYAKTDGDSAAIKYADQFKHSGCFSKLALQQGMYYCAIKVCTIAKGHQQAFGKRLVKYTDEAVI